MMGYLPLPAYLTTGVPVLVARSVCGTTEGGNSQPLTAPLGSFAGARSSQICQEPPLRRGGRSANCVQAFRNRAAREGLPRTEWRFGQPGMQDAVLVGPSSLPQLRRRPHRVQQKLTPNGRPLGLQIQTLPAVDCPPHLSPISLQCDPLMRRRCLPTPKGLARADRRERGSPPGG
jgi:hypothetical protein